MITKKRKYIFFSYLRSHLKKKNTHMYFDYNSEIEGGYFEILLI